MLSKTEAAIRFVEGGGSKKVIITNLEQAYEALTDNKDAHIRMQHFITRQNIKYVSPLTQMKKLSTDTLQGLKEFNL